MLEVTDSIEAALGRAFTELEREAWVWMENRFIPYPFQNNIKDLEPATVVECLMGLIESQRHEQPREIHLADQLCVADDAAARRRRRRSS